MGVSGCECVHIFASTSVCAFVCIHVCVHVCCACVYKHEIMILATKGISLLEGFTGHHNFIQNTTHTLY